MDYELAKTLKSMGFRQSWPDMKQFCQWIMLDGEELLIPSLSQIIIELGSHFDYLRQVSSKEGELWAAFSRNNDDGIIAVSPEIAAANLWIALHDNRV